MAKKNDKEKKEDIQKSVFVKSLNKVLINKK